MTDLERFVKAQDSAGRYHRALEEIRAGQKRTHWIWYVFPQIRGLGDSENSRFYAIQSMEEAKAYLAHPVLRSRLEEICQVLLDLESNDAREVLGVPDNQKVRSSMTLFSLAEPETPIYQKVLDKFYRGKPDNRTIYILRDIQAGRF